ncbi:MAG: hypothetical protein J5787_00175 [Alphaproteobacteria bacterium]|nr:hypothetical protein [Alphaproteobacteria bacterium]MBO4643924.1 hypothetical protein [Alphaproteobacteria bacterium]
MSDHDTEILKLVLKKENDFAKEIARLADLAETSDLVSGLSEYLSGLSDLKNDFLLPLQKECSDDFETAETFLADKYWYCQRT